MQGKEGATKAVILSQFGPALRSILVFQTRDAATIGAKRSHLFSFESFILLFYKIFIKFTIISVQRQINYKNSPWKN